MSREFENQIAGYHHELAKQFAAGRDGKKRHIECRITDEIYVYLWEDGVHIQTQTVPIPPNWRRRWPSDAQVRFYIRNRCQLGAARITTLAA